MTAPVIEPGLLTPVTVRPEEEGRLGCPSSSPPSAITVREGRNRISLRCGVCGVRSCYEGPRARRAEFAGMFTAAHVFCEEPWWEEDSSNE